MTTFVTDPLAFVVESTGFEPHVTLLVDGVPIVGALTSVRRYHRWMTDAMRLFGEVGELELDGTAPPATEAERQDIRAKFKEQLIAREDDEEDDAPAGSLSFPELCVRNAQVRHGLPMHWKSYPYLLVNAARVGAVTLGHPD